MEVEKLKTKSSGDIMLCLTKGTLGAIPLLGAAASEIFGLIVTPPLEKRRIEWMNEVAEKLKELEDTNRINLTELANNEKFVDVVVQATTFALRTSQNEKKEAFKSAILNTAIGCSLDETITNIFLNQLDRFTVWHIKILQILNSPIDARLDKSELGYYAYDIILVRFIAYTYQELRCRSKSDLIRLICLDLKRAGFCDVDGEDSVAVDINRRRKMTTELGDKFLDYIKF